MDALNNFLFVWVYPEARQSPTLCGVLELLQGRRCWFSYDAAWLAHPEAFALCPDMPLRTGVIAPSGGLELHPIFEDAGPDRWGKNVINKVFNPIRRSPLDYLELAGEDRIGALAFSRSADNYQVAQEQAFYSAQLPDLVRAANALSAQMPIDNVMRRLLRPGSSAGGARPKAIVQHKGADWIAKFASDEDDCDVCAIEHASLRLATLCGIEAVASELIEIDGKNILLVKRFDREHINRVHFASARSILIAEGIAEDAMSYADLADAARRLSSSPEMDCEQLFRRMVLNVLIENTDDHAKNQAFLYRNRHWRLAPAYDIQPQRQGIGYHLLRIGKEGHVPTLSNLLSETNRFLLKRDVAARIAEDIVRQVSAWREVFANQGVPLHDIEFCANYIMRQSIFS